MAESLREYCERRKRNLWDERSTWDGHYKELQRWFSPRRGRFLTSERNRGKKLNQIINSTSIMALRVMSAGMQSGITSPNRPWFSYGLFAESSPRPELGEWLKRLEQLSNLIIGRSNSYNAFYQMYGELGQFGTHPTLLMEDFDTVIRCYPLTVGQYALGTDDKLQVVTLVRQYSLQVRELIKLFGRERVSLAVKSLSTKNEDEWVDIKEIYEPNDNEFDLPDQKVQQVFPWRSVVWEDGGDQDQVLSTNGFFEKPFIAPRWDVLSEDIYGRSPGMDALGDVKQLDQEEEDKSTIIAKIARPSMQAPSNAKNRGLRDDPGHTNYYDVAIGAQPYAPVHTIDPNAYQYLTNDIAAVQERIRHAMYADLFMLFFNINRPTMTATEVTERAAERMLALGQVLDRLNQEAFDDYFRRLIGIITRKQLIEPPPALNSELPLKVEYDSVLSQAQKAVGVGNMDRFLAVISGIAQVDPNAVAKFNSDAFVDEYSDMLRIPPKVVREGEELEEHRERMARAQAAAQRLALAEQAANTTKTLSETPMDTNSALDRVMEGVGAP